MSYILESLTEYQVTNAIYEDEHNGFDYEQSKALAEYLYELVVDTDTPIELDLVGIRCEWTAYDSWQDLQASYSDYEEMVLAELETMAEPEDSEMNELAELFLRDNTTYLRVGDTFLVQHF